MPQNWLLIMLVLFHIFMFGRFGIEKQFHFSLFLPGHWYSWYIQHLLCWMNAWCHYFANSRIKYWFYLSLWWFHVLLFPSKECMTVSFFSVQLNFLKIDLFLIFFPRFWGLCFCWCGFLVCLVVVVWFFWLKGGRLGVFMFGWGCFSNLDR